MYNVYTCTCNIDLESSVVAPISRQPEVDSSSRLEDDFDLDEETELDSGEPSAAQIVEAGIAQGQLDVSSVPTNQSTLDEAEETLIQEFVCELVVSVILGQISNHVPPPSQWNIFSLFAVRWLS